MLAGLLPLWKLEGRIHFLVVSGYYRLPAPSHSTADGPFPLQSQQWLVEFSSDCSILSLFLFCLLFSLRKSLWWPGAHSGHPEQAPDSELSWLATLMPPATWILCHGFWRSGPKCLWKGIILPGASSVPFLQAEVTTDDHYVSKGILCQSRRLWHASPVSEGFQPLVLASLFLLTGTLSPTLSYPGCILQRLGLNAPFFIASSLSDPSWRKVALRWLTDIHTWNNKVIVEIC